MLYFGYGNDLLYDQKGKRKIRNYVLINKTTQPKMEFDLEMASKTTRGRKYCL